MDKFPHEYITRASAKSDSLISLSSENMPQTTIAGPPPQFGGDKGHWSPEDLFCASISSCFILTFKSYCSIKKLNWEKLDVEAHAFLDKSDRKLSFNKVVISAKLEVCCEGNADPFLEALHKAKEQCLITNSIKSEVEFHPKLIIRAK